jgi:TPR repeat protein
MHLLIFTIRVMLTALLFPCFFSSHVLSGEKMAVEEDIKQIVRLAESGDAEAQFSYAMMLDQGDRVVMDRPAAIFWFRMAAEQDVPAACLYLGLKYEYGNMVEQDISQAIHWYRKAALQNWPDAQFYLGRLLLEGNDKVRNPVHAAAWLSLAEEWDFPGADEEKERAILLLSEQELTQVKKLQNKLRKQIENNSD